MKLLLDTHVLILSVHKPKLLSRLAKRHLEDLENELYFSVISLWEIGVKRSLHRADFRFDPNVLRHALVADGYRELGLTADHVLALGQLAPLHRDPFDRMLLCQALVEGITLMTDDQLLTQYRVSTLQV